MAKVQSEEVAEILDELSSRQIYMKNEESLANLAAVSILCTSKAGVITQDRLVVHQLWTEGRTEQVIFSEDSEVGSKQVEDWSCLERAAALCNNAEFAEDQDCISLMSMMKAETTGNSIDSAVFKYMQFISGGKVMECRESNKKVAQIPFNSDSKFHLSIHQAENGDRVVMKGAPEKILEKCSTILMNGEDTRLLTPNGEVDQIVNTIEEAIKELAGLGERVIGFCDLLLPKDEYPDDDDYKFGVYNEGGFRFLGLMSFYDWLRASAPDAITSLGSKLGDKIKVVMITGDHPVTAKAVARSTGIIGLNTKIVEGCKALVDPEEDAGAAIVLGSDLNTVNRCVKDLSDDALREILQKYPEVVFARTSSQQKMRIVKAYQKLGHKVAVTGSHLNDIPALKSADLGIAVGFSPSEDVKNAADMVITDYNNVLGSIVNAVEQARVVFNSAN